MLRALIATVACAARAVVLLSSAGRQPAATTSLHEAHGSAPQAAEDAAGDAPPCGQEASSARKHASNSTVKDFALISRFQFSSVKRA